MRKMLVLACAFALGASMGGQRIWAAAPSEVLQSARDAYALRATAAKAREAVALFRKASEADPQSYEAAWEGSRACYFLGHYAMADAGDKELLDLFQDGIDRAKKAVGLKPKEAEGHFWLGVLDGVYGETKGIFKSLSLVPEIKQEMAACLDIDPGVEGHGPGRVLGRLYYKLPGFKGGDNKKSIDYLERSLQGTPTNALTRLYLAETYKAEGQKARAISLLQEIVTMTPDPRWAPEHPLIKAQAEAMLKKLG